MAELPKKLRDSIARMKEQPSPIRITLGNEADKKAYPKTYALVEAISEGRQKDLTALHHTNGGYQVRRIGMSFLMVNIDAAA